MRLRPRAPLVLGSLTIVFVAIGSLTSHPATAAEGLAIEARGGFGVGSMLSQWQRDRGYQSGFVPELRGALRLDTSLAAELAFESWFFPRDNGGTGRASFFGAGGRWDPHLIDWLTWFLDGHAGLALTGPANRFMFDLGTGFDVWVARSIAVGPFLRYGQIVGQGADPRFWAAGLGATMTWGGAGDEPPKLGPRNSVREERQREWERARQREREAPPPRDRDHDGVADDRDICPDEPAGPHPDPNMIGCPLQERAVDKQPAAAAAPEEVDSDGDGIPDRDDKCPDKPFGKYPDPLLLGCPLPDRDHDGIPDVFDACPNKRGKPSPKARKNGCAAGQPAAPAKASEPWA